MTGVSCGTTRFLQQTGHPKVGHEYNLLYLADFILNYPTVKYDQEDHEKLLHVLRAFSVVGH